MKPLLSYEGGKQVLTNRILPHLPEHKYYVEPFAGGASLFFAKEPVLAEVINDVDDQLVTFYRVAQRRPKALIREIAGTAYSRSEYKRAIAVLRGECFRDELTVAWAVYVARLQSFGNASNRTKCSGWCTSHINGSRNTSRIWSNKTNPAVLRKQIRRLHGVFIECSDAISIIRKYNRPGTLVYCDPPYPGTDHRYVQDYSTDDWRYMIEELERSGSSAVVSGYEHPDLTVSKLWKRVALGTSYVGNGKQGHSGTREREEYIWILDRT